MFFLSGAYGDWYFFFFVGGGGVLKQIGVLWFGVESQVTCAGQETGS